MKWLLLFSGIAANAAANLLVKMAVSDPARMLALKQPVNLLTNVSLWAGIVLYAVAFALYAVTLTKLPLNVAHPILTSGAIIAVACLSVITLKEPFYWTTGLGIAFVVLGVSLISRQVV